MMTAESIEYVVPQATVNGLARLRRRWFLISSAMAVPTDVVADEWTEPLRALQGRRRDHRGTIARRILWRMSAPHHDRMRQVRSKVQNRIIVACS